MSAWPDFPLTRTAFPWVPLARWEEHPHYGVWKVHVTHPSPGPHELRAVHSGWHERPQDAWEDLYSVLEFWHADRSPR